MNKICQRTKHSLMLTLNNICIIIICGVISTSIIICPKCEKPLHFYNKYAKCENNHLYDIAKEGYLNLLLSSKNGSLIGDNKEMAKHRRDFLNKNYFSALKIELQSIISENCNENKNVLDICCGEGYYSSEISANIKGNFYGFDISKEMVKLAAKRNNSVKYFVANMTNIPIKDNSVDFAIQLFSPFCEKEFSRVLKRNGTLISVIPGERHLWQLKEALYNKPYINDEKPPVTNILELTSTVKIKDKILLASNEDIQSAFKMTPYYYHTAESDKAKINNLQSLKTETEFILLLYKKN